MEIKSPKRAIALWIVSAAVATTLFVGCSGLFSQAFRDDCMDNDIFHSIESNGRAVVHVYYEGQRVEVPGTKTGTPLSAAIPHLKIAEVATGVSKLSISYLGRYVNVKDTTFGNDLWSSKNFAYFYIESKSNTISEQKWLCRWNPTNGFEKLRELSGTIISVSLSLDQDAVVIDEYEPTAKSQSCFLVYTLKDRRSEVIPRPDWAAHPVMIGPRSFLLRRHETGNNGHVVRWIPGQPDKDTAKSELWIDGGLMTDVTNLDGEIWALQQKNCADTIVHLDRNLSLVVQDVGWVEEAEQPRSQP